MGGDGGVGRAGWFERGLGWVVLGCIGLYWTGLDWMGLGMEGGMG